MLSINTIAPFPLTVLVAALVSLNLAAPVWATPSDDAPPLPPMQLPFKAGESWRVGSQNGNGGSYFGEGLHRNRNPAAPFNVWGDYYATDWNNLAGGNEGRAVYPVADGVVVASSCDYTIGYGCTVVLDHGLGNDSQRFRTRYAHLGAASVSLFPVGAHVLRWQQIGWVGNTGNNPAMAAHLHLSALALDRSSGTAKFASNCASGQNSSYCDNGELYLTPQSRRIDRVFTQNSNGEPQSVNLADGLNVVSGNRPTLIVPGIFSSVGTGRSVSVQISNADTATDPNATNAISVTWYNTWGNVVRVDNRTLTRHQSINLAAPSSRNVYTAVISGEAGKDIAAVAKIHDGYQNASGQNRIAYAAFEPVSQPRASQVIPVWHRDNYGWNSVIRVFNPDLAPIRIDVQYQAVSVNGQQPPVCSKTYGMVRYQTLNLASDAVDCLSPGQYGTASVRAYYYDVASNQETGPALVAASYEQAHENAATKERSLIASGASQAVLSDVAGASILYAPLIQNNNYGWLSGLSANRLEGNGDLLLDFYPPAGDVSVCGQQDNDGIWPFVRAPLFPVGSDCGYPVLAAQISAAANGVRYVSAQINQTNGLNASGYPAIAAPGKRIYIPLLQHGGSNPSQTSGIQLQNTSTSSAAQVTFTYYDNTGASFVRQETIPANGFLILPKTGHDFPANVVNAEIVSSTALAAVVNIVAGSNCADCILSYVPAMRN